MDKREKRRWMLYRHEMTRHMEHGLGKGCGPRLYIACIIAAILLLAGCHTVKSELKEKTDTSESVRTEYRERLVKVPVTVYVDVPVEVKERVSADSASHLETAFAVSDARMVWIDGVMFLRHSLENKPQKIARQDSVTTTEKERIIWRTRRVTYNRTKEIYVEKALTWWQKALMWAGIAGIVLVVVKRVLKGLGFKIC